MIILVIWPLMTLMTSVLFSLWVSLRTLILVLIIQLDRRFIFYYLRYIFHILLSLICLFFLILNLLLWVSLLLVMTLALVLWLIIFHLVFIHLERLISEMVHLIRNTCFLLVRLVKLSRVILDLIINLLSRLLYLSLIWILNYLMVRLVYIWVLIWDTLGRSRNLLSQLSKVSHTHPVLSWHSYVLWWWEARIYL